MHQPIKTVSWLHKFCQPFLGARNGFAWRLNKEPSLIRRFPFAPYKNQKHKGKSELMQNQSEIKAKQNQSKTKAKPEQNQSETKVKPKQTSKTKVKPK